MSTTDKLSKKQIENDLSSVKVLVSFAFENERSFTERFTSIEDAELISASLNDENFHFIVIDYSSGEHIMNHVSMTEFVEWYLEN